MASDIQICNIALSNIGVAPIQSFQENSKAARECNLRYGVSRDSVLRDHDWNFARKTETLALLPDTYLGYSYAYQYPVDCVAARKIYDDKTELLSTAVYVDANGEAAARDEIKFELLGQKILTEKAEAVLIYTYRVENSSLFDGLFIDALCYRLAADLAPSLRGQVSLQDRMMKAYSLLVMQAKQASLAEGQGDLKETSGFVEARL